MPHLVKRKWRPSKREILVKILPTILLVAIFPITLVMIQQQQNYRQFASEITSGNMVLNATFNSIGIEVKNTTEPLGTLEFKKKSESNWRKGLDMWQAGDALYGSALLLEPGTEYEVKVTYGTNVAQGSIFTREDNIAHISTLSPTHFVRSDGDNSNSGTSDDPNGAWRTISKALDVVSDGAIIQVGPGYYGERNLSTSKRVTLVAQYPALDDNRNEINHDKRTVLETGVVTGPLGSGAPYMDVWVPETITGPNSGQTYTLYKWASSPYGKPSHMGYASTREGMPQRLTNFKMKSDWSDAKRAEFMFENNKYNYGWFVSQNSSSTVYLRLPPHASAQNPNQLFITFGHGSGITSTSSGDPVNGSNFRISGFEIRGFGAGVLVKHPATHAVIDHNLIGAMNTGVRFDGNKDGTIAYGSDHVVQYNKITDSNLRPLPGSSKNGYIPWQFIKSGASDPYGGSQNRTGEESESGVIDGRGGAQRVVIRHNLFDGTFNGIGTYEVGYDKYASANMDVHDNIFQNFADDALLEHEPNGINQRIWNNRLQYVTVMATMSESNYGPHYIFRNTIYRWGVNELSGPVSNPSDIYPPGGTLFKMSTGHSAKSRVYLINNTFWTDDSARTKGWHVANGGTGGPPDFYIRNNIIRSSWRAGHDGIGPNNWNEDYNFIMTESTPDDTGHRWLGSNANLFRSVDDLQEYRQVSNGAMNTNRINGTDYSFIDTDFLDSNFVNIQNGDLRLRDDSVLIDKGVPVPNIFDNYDTQSSYAGSAPDLGAVEVGGVNPSSTPIPTPTVQVNPTVIATPTVKIEPTSTPTKIPTPTPTRAPSPTISKTVSPTPTRTPTPTVSSAQRVTGFMLVNADTDRDLYMLNNNQVINLSELPTKKLNIRAITSPETVGSVKFLYDNKSFSIENNPPYAMAGNSGNNYQSWTPSLGIHVITAIPYSSSNATGTVGSQYSVIVNFVEESTGGDGLFGSYFDNKDLTNLKFTRTDPVVNFNWKTGSPGSGVSSDTFSVRWIGYVMPEYSQKYTFYTESDDGARLWVDNQLLIDKWSDHSRKRYGGSIHLEAGKKYLIRLEYYDNRRNASVGLYWSSSSTSYQLIPQSRLYTK